ncbi:MAG: methylmalonyl Co-A mutase-associated GTPase MeaB, partial [Chlorobium limicola]|nr:methylmalonyl Co-A mutase-associated GTPase MeaB [Chlorobium limicola]
RFFSDPCVQGVQSEIERLVLSGTLSPFSGAKSLLDAFQRAE